MMLLLVAGALGACNGDEPVVPDVDIGPLCDTVAWDLLQTLDADSLSTYRLFASGTDPTTNPNDTGMPYGLNTGLFTDYASKYRFVFIPCDSAAVYDDNEAFAFPVGTVITKTFAMPADTGLRGVENETIIETRLLIHRPSGWVALPYVWLDDGSDAILNDSGVSVPTSVTHKGTRHDFNYRVPTQPQCVLCHTLDGGVAPIGPKARQLNGDHDYGSGPENQLEHWSAAGRLDGLPDDLSTVVTMPVFDDDTDLAALNSEAERNRYAKAYLDVNCAHCHRPRGANGNRTPYFEYWRDINLNVDDDDHGICTVIIPGDVDGSGLHFMMQIGLMPKIGTVLLHEEGLELIEYWIDNMPYVCP